MFTLVWTAELIEFFSNLSDDWMIFIAGVVGTIIGFAGRQLANFLFPDHRPKVRARFEQLPRPPKMPAPNDQATWDHFDDGGRHAIVRLENIGKAAVTLRSVSIQVGKGPVEVLVGSIHESKRSDGRFEAHQIEMNSFCTFQAKVPSGAFKTNSQIEFYFSGAKRPTILKIQN